MKVYNDNRINELNKELNEKLIEYRNERQFNEVEYVNEKARILNDYFNISKLNTCIIAISGGIDSAIVYKIAKVAQQLPGGLQHIKAVTMPAVKNTGVTNQAKTVQKAKDLVGEDLIILNVDSISKCATDNLYEILPVEANDWAKGQMVPYLRTSLMYSFANLLTMNGTPALILGTTNSDEGSYLGYVGKASDGLVDLQVISDLHKSEVYKVAKYLNVPKSILLAKPTGDMFDSREDEELFGAPYDFVELYFKYLKMDENQKKEFTESLSNEAISEFNIMRDNLENLHSYNAHKYLSLSPAVHLDLYDMSLTNGWINYKERFEDWYNEHREDKKR